MNKGDKLHFWLGVSVGAIVAVALVFSVIYIPRKGFTFGAETLSFSVVLKEAHGLHVGSPVTIGGIEAGEVVDLRITPVPNLGVRVLATVDIFDGEAYGPVLSDASVYRVARSGLLGAMTVSITPGGDGTPLREGALVAGSGPADLMQVADNVARVTSRLADFMDGGKLGDPSLRKALKDLQALVRNLRQFSQKLPN
jgi:ABC-type transporter Mla subunit MlaD